jgi:hypothetical protein
VGCGDKKFAKRFEQIGLAKGHMAIHPSVGFGSWRWVDKLLEPGSGNPEPKDFTGQMGISSRFVRRGEDVPVSHNHP